MELFINDEKVHLNPQSQKVFRLLIERSISSWYATEKLLYETLWGEFYGNEKNCNDAIRRIISQLRKHLGKEAIVTIRGQGYKLANKPEYIPIENQERCYSNSIYSNTSNHKKPSTYREILDELKDLYMKTEEIRQLSSGLRNEIKNEQDALLHFCTAENYLDLVSELLGKTTTEFQNICTLQNNVIVLSKQFRDSNTYAENPTTFGLVTSYSSPTPKSTKNDYSLIADEILSLNQKIDYTKHKIDKIYDEFSTLITHKKFAPKTSLDFIIN